ncbi:putative solute carrier family 22 member 31 [Scleropages formosus]|uniref:Solute carrier family 22 member 31 n=1 Tax=Scleropages formosus TaxID=113540 RepID=A0A8C9TY66_SCLFO|nr:putative solute carrier family 22 member 31 [Scleropages formosus]
MDFDSRIYPRIGGFGRYSRAVVSLSWPCGFAVALAFFSDVFFTLLPDSYRCRTDPALLPAALPLGNLSEAALLNVSVPWEPESGWSRCQLYRYPRNSSGNISSGTSEWSRPAEDHVPREAVPCTRGWHFSTSAGLHSNYVTEWNLVCENYWKVPLQHICFMMGCMLGYIFMGTLCDRLGRRRAFLVSVALSGLLGMAVCLSNGPLVFLLLRLCQGAMLSGIFLSSYIARLEMCDPPHRLMMTMIGGFFAVCAELLLPGLAAMCRDWPVLQAVATVPLLLLLSYWCSASIFPESPRWLLATHQILQARKCLENISTRNGVCVGEELYPAESLLAEMDVAYPDDSEPRFHHVLELRHSRVIWRNGLILGFTLFIGTGIQYCFTRNLHGFSHHFYLTYFVRVATGAVACALLCVTVERCGRRGVLLLSAITTGLSSLLLLALTQYLRSGLVLVLSVLGLLSSQALAMLSVFFASEVLPTVVRGGALGLVLAAGCVGMAASSLMELQNNSGYFLHNVVFASFAVLSVLCVMLLPETKSKPLPDSLKDGENQRRPAFFASRPGRDSLPLLRTLPHDSHYDPDSYSRLVSATKKMLAKDRSYGLPPPQQRPLLAVDNGLLDCQENKLLHEDNS